MFFIDFAVSENKIRWIKFDTCFQNFWNDEFDSFYILSNSEGVFSTETVLSATQMACMLIDLCFFISKYSEYTGELLLFTEVTQNTAVGWSYWMRVKTTNKST